MNDRPPERICARAFGGWPLLLGIALVLALAAYAWWQGRPG